MFTHTPLATFRRALTATLTNRFALTHQLLLAPHNAARVCASVCVSGWADAGFHRNYTIGGVTVPPTDEVQTPTLNALVDEGIHLFRNYVYKYCSPTRSAIQSGRNPYHVNPLNLAPVRALSLIHI